MLGGSAIWGCLAQARAERGNPWGLAMPIAVIAILWLFLMVLPQRREQKKTQEFLASLKKNDRVLLSSGIVGTIVSAQADAKFVTVRVDEGTGAKLRVLRSAVVRLASDDESEAERA